MFTRRNLDSWPKCLVMALIDGTFDGWKIEVLTSELSVAVAATQGTFSVTAMCRTFEQAARSVIEMVRAANLIDNEHEQNNQNHAGVGRA